MAKIEIESTIGRMHIKKHIKNKIWNIALKKILGWGKKETLAGIKFHGWAKLFVSRELNFGEDSLKRKICKI